MPRKSFASATTDAAGPESAASLREAKPSPQEQSPAGPMLRLQRTLGNRALRRLVDTSFWQAKLRIGAPNDRFEQEADRTADAILRMSVPEPAVHDFMQAPPDRQQRLCESCEEEEQLQRTLQDDNEEEALRPKAKAEGPAQATREVESNIRSQAGGGRALPASARAFFEPRFGHDFSNVRIHTGRAAIDATRAVHARAFTLGRDIMFGAGEYAPHSHAGRQLMAHELTHVVQQTPKLARRKPDLQRSAEDGAAHLSDPSPEPQPAAPEEGSSELILAPGRIVSDETGELAAGQMRKSEFMAETRNTICTTADSALAPTEFSTEGCPWIELILRFYENRSADQIEQEVVRYLPAGSHAATARDYIPLIAERVRQSVAIWVQTGMVTGIPEGLPSVDKIAGLAGAGSTEAALLFKSRQGGPRNALAPGAVSAQLGAGRPMSGSARSRMESAYGRNFSHVRIHTDAKAARLSNRFNARAFTVGSHVAFGANEYRPGTLAGDALLAHELAHVQQQRGIAASTSSLSQSSSATHALESDADRSAVGTIARLWAGTRQRFGSRARNAAPMLRSGLRLQRCSKKKGKGSTGTKDCNKEASCTEICDKAYRDSSLNGQGGGVICCHEKKCACVFDIPVGSGITRGQCPEIDRIVMVHERRHLADVDCDPSQGLHRPPFRDQSKATTSECTHRKETITLLDQARTKAAEPCKTKMMDLRTVLDTWVKANCGP